MGGGAALPRRVVGPAGRGRVSPRSSTAAGSSSGPSTRRSDSRSTSWASPRITVVTAPLLNDTLPRSLPVLAPPVALVGAAAGRWFYRAIRDRSATLARRGRSAGSHLRRRRRRSSGASSGDDRRRASGLTPVGFIDDNPGKRHLRIHGVPVLGAGQLLAEIAAEARRRRGRPRGARRLRRTGRPRAACRHRGWTRVLRAPAAGRPHRRPGRSPPTSARSRSATCSAATRSRPTCPRSPATSPASGCSSPAPVARSAPSSPARCTASARQRWSLLDRDESALHSVQLAIYGHGLLDGPDTVLADIRDEESLRDGLRTRTGRRSCSTRPRSSTCRCSSASPTRAGRPTCWARSTCSARRRVRASSTSSTSRPTRRPTRPASWARPSGWPSS